MKFAGMEYTEGSILLDNETLIRVFKWVVKHGQTFPLRRFVENGGGAKKLTATIDADKPL